MPEVYRPDLSTFCDILRDYSQHGLLYFKNQTRDMQQKIRSALRGELEDNPEQIDHKLGTIKKGGQSLLQFLPMPQPGGTDFKASFFLPRITRENSGNYTCSFIVIFWIERDMGKTMAIRIEPSGDPGNAHAYTHMQLTRTSGNITTSLENWTPESYPALPLGYHHPLQLFIGMAVAVHGYSRNDQKEYIRAAITDSMSQGSSALRARRILDEVKLMLDLRIVH